MRVNVKLTVQREDACAQFDEDVDDEENVEDERHSPQHLATDRRCERYKQHSTLSVCMNLASLL